MSVLDKLFSPKSVAVIGATESTGVGRSILENLTAVSTRPVYPVNPKRASVLGRRCYPSIADTPERVELAIVVTPAATVPSVIQDCAHLRIPSAIVISAGFREAGPRGQQLERETLKAAQSGGVRLLGPNCLGLMNPHAGLNATFAKGMARPGKLGFISQSGALCSAILDWSQREQVGFSAFVSAGSMSDIGWGDLILHLGDDPHTRAIALYVESIDDARAFASAAREVALSKPIVAIKPGRTQAAARAAASHTGALTGQDEVLDAVFRRCGVLRVDSIAELFDLSEALDMQPRPRGSRLAIVTNAGGPAVLATDAAVLAGATLPELAPETISQLDSFLPSHWSHANPVDVLGDAPPDRFARAVQSALADPNTDGLLAIVAPQAMTDPAETAKQFVLAAHTARKPVLASWMGGDGVAEGVRILSQASIPTYSYPDAAARVFASMAQFDSTLKLLYETPLPDPSARQILAPDTNAEVAARLEAVRASGRTLLTEFESKELLRAYGIPVTQTEVATTAEEAVEAATRIGYPVVVKLHSQVITHKSDIGGVRLNLRDASAVRAAFEDIRKAANDGFLGVTVQPMIGTDGYELILGTISDAQFGPVIVFGSGGRLVEILKDRCTGLPPLNTTLARRMIERTTAFPILKGVRGQRPVDLAELERILVRFSEIPVLQPAIAEIDVNPLLASPTGLCALDARVLLHPVGKQSQRPAIRPYPVHYVRPWRFADGSEVQIRPIRPDDETAMVEFHKTLSDRSVYLRYFHMLGLEERIAHERLLRTCFSDYDREMVLVAEQGQSILAVGRLSRAHFARRAELSVLISDRHQGQGLGTEISRRLIEIARSENIGRIDATFLDENVLMRSVFEELGFTLEPDPPGTTRATLLLD